MLLKKNTVWDVDILLGFQFPVVLSYMISIVFDDELSVNDCFAIVSVKLYNDVMLTSGPHVYFS